METPASPAGVLFIDDEPSILRALTRVCRSEPFDVHTARSGQEAFSVLEENRIHVVVSDQQMPGTPGVSLLQQIRECFPDAIRIMLTGYTEMNVAVDAINNGEIYRLLIKPWNDDELRATLRQALDTHRMREEIHRLNHLTQEQNGALQEMNRNLEVLVRDRTVALKDKHEELQRAYVETVRALAEAVDAKDAYTRGHSERVAVYASRIAGQLGSDRKFIEKIYLAGLLHDIGKIGVPDAILTKPGRLTSDEYDVMKQHPEIGARILEPVSFLAGVVPCVRHHHEWYDGSDRGYPDKLSGLEIPYESRIILVADTVEAMTSDRPYRRGLPMDVVVDEIEKFRGTQFDPAAADAFLAIIEREGDDFIERASKFDIARFLVDGGDCG